jgi:hypothetical protein
MKYTKIYLPVLNVADAGLDSSFGYDQTPVFPLSVVAVVVFGGDGSATYYNDSSLDASGNLNITKLSKSLGYPESLEVAIPSGFVFQSAILKTTISTADLSAAVAANSAFVIAYYDCPLSVVIRGYVLPGDYMIHDYVPNSATASPVIPPGGSFDGQDIVLPYRFNPAIPAEPA